MTREINTGWETDSTYVRGTKAKGAQALSLLLTRISIGRGLFFLVNTARKNGATHNEEGVRSKHSHSR